jgi:hypothetical protein
MKCNIRLLYILRVINIILDFLHLSNTDGNKLLVTLNNKKIQLPNNVFSYFKR